VDAVLERRAGLDEVQAEARASSRSARISGSGSQISGTKRRSDSSAKTRASVLSVLSAAGAIRLAL
jgi:hypothetical protein